jgi:hypothetical protein
MVMMIIMMYIIIRPYSNHCCSAWHVRYYGLMLISLINLWRRLSWSFRGNIIPQNIFGLTVASYGWNTPTFQRLTAPLSGFWTWVPISIVRTRMMETQSVSETSSSVEVKERVELYLYSPSGPSWPVLGWTLPLPLSTKCCLVWILYLKSRWINTTGWLYLN